MKSILFVLGILLATQLFCPAAEPEKEKAPESLVSHGTNGETIVTLPAATREIMGLQTAPLASTQLTPELKAYGSVLDVTPLAALTAELTIAKAASEASEAELQRLKSLAQLQNASTRAVQTAEAAAARDRAQVESGRLRLLAGWGSAIAVRHDLASFVQSLSSLSNVLVQLEAPAGQLGAGIPSGARLLTLAREDQPIEALYLGPATAVNPQTQGRGFLFLVNSNGMRLAPGAAVSGFLSLPGEAVSGVLVPRDAVLRYKGATWVYLQQTEEKYQRTEVFLKAPLTQGWFVERGLKPGDQLVTVGAQQLLSEELKGQETE